MDATTNPKVLFVYYTFTKQALKVTEDMESVFRDRGWEIARAEIEFTDQRYVKNFARFPMKHRYFDVIRMLPAQLRRATGEIKTPPEAEGGDYDLVVIGSPTWWLTTCMPIRSYLKSDAAGTLLNGKSVAAFVVCRRYWKNNLKTVKKLAEGHGATSVATTHFAYLGGQIRSLLSLISYLGTGEYHERYLGVKIPPTNLQRDGDAAARAFAVELADRFADVRTSPGAP
jgi:menaquinone-dependent protoporphyrinogen IX oxidase